MTYPGQEPAHDVSTSTETPLQGEVGSQGDRTSGAVREALVDACDGSDDPRRRCGLHHATGLAMGGGYACCCGRYWTSRNVCESGAGTGQPVELRQRIYEALAYTVDDTPHDIDKHTEAVLDVVTTIPAPVVDPDEFDRYRIVSLTGDALFVNCPRDECQGVDLAPAADDVLTLGDLMGIATDHEAEAHGGYQPIRCQVVDGPNGPLRVQADGPLPDGFGEAITALAEQARNRSSEPISASPEIDPTLRLFVHEYGDWFATREQGRTVRAAALELLTQCEDAQTLILDFSGVQAMTNASADALIGELVASQGGKRSIVIDNVGEGVREAIALTLARRGLPVLRWLDNREETHD